MKVYRYLNEIELKHILNNETEKLGSVFKNEDVKHNNFKYKPNENYLHFFKNKKSMQEIKALIKNKKGRYYYCEFEIPIKNLVFHSGIGTYTPHGYEDNIVREYALPVSKFKCAWLKKYEADEENAHER